MPRGRRFAIAASAFLFLSLSGIEATRLGIAGDVRHSIEMRRPLEGGYAWLAGADLASVREALSLDPGDPTLHEMAAFGDANAHRDPGGVTTHLKRSIALRPVSPYAWAALEADRYVAGAPVTELEKPLMNATLLGPSESAVQRIVADFGLALWNETGPAVRGAVGRALGAGIGRDPNEFMQIAERRGRLDVACRHFDGSSRAADTKWTITCNRLEATS